MRNLRTPLPHWLGAVVAGVLLGLLPACTQPNATRPPVPQPAHATPALTSPPTANPAPAQPSRPLPARFDATVSPLPAGLAAQMRGRTWQPGCPVPLRELRLLSLRYWGFDGQVHQGPMVVNQAVARQVVTARGPLASWSQHAYGLAIDVNPIQNPYVASDGYVRNLHARRYRDRSLRRPGMIHHGDVAVRAFAAIGWKWGGDWDGHKDYMHFSATGR